MGTVQIALAAILAINTAVAGHFFLREAGLEFPDLGERAPVAIASTPGQGNVMSHIAHQRVLMQCDGVLSPQISRLSVAEQLRSNAVICRALAAQILNDIPTFSFAHFIYGISALHVGNKGEFIQHIALSQRFAPSEGWLAQKRFVQLADLQDATLDQVLIHDAGVLLTTQSGAELLARYFQRRAGLRGPIKASLLLASASDQRRLLNRIALLVAAT